MTRDEFIGKLRSIYVGEENAIDEIISEYDRLNNIINELEKYCDKEIEDYNKAINSKILSEIGRDKYEAEKMCFLDITDKLKELKENKNA